MAEPRLDPQERLRFARQILLPEIGAQGQAALLDARFEAPKTRAGAIASDYLERAGLRRGLASEHALALELPASDEPTADPIQDVLTGSFAAVELLKRVLGVGQPGSLSSHDGGSEFAVGRRTRPALDAPDPAAPAGADEGS